MTATRVLLLENHPELGLTLRRVLESQPGVRVVAETGVVPVAMELARRHAPDVAVVDGLDHLEELRREFPGMAIIVLSLHSDERYLARARNAGARGYVLKQSVEDDLAGAIEQVRAGKTYVSPGLLSRSARG